MVMYSIVVNGNQYNIQLERSYLSKLPTCALDHKSMKRFI